ncbi:MAG TPA: hypothetical protein DEP79_07100 [Gammaproteobacteria bacterium]|nr:hypothetical protein [Gammaproteobacteria bacterium]
MKRILTALVWGVGLLATTGYALTPPLHPIDAFKIITIEGEDAPGLVGMPLEQLSLAAMIDGVLEPIPYQIDQYNIGGAVYFEGWHVPLAGSAQQMDETDKLLFLFKDAGERYRGRLPHDGSILAEIRMRDEQGYLRYVYVMKNSRLRSDEQYVRYSAAEGVVETDFYSIRYNKNNHLVWDDFSYVNYLGERPLDSLNLQLRGGILTSLAEVELGKDQLVAVPKGELIGPIRTTTQLDFSVYFMALPVLNLSVQIHHGPKSLMYDVRGVIPELRRSLVADPTITMSIDANRLLGASIMTSAAPGRVGTVDGTIDEQEQSVIDAGLDPHDNWIWVSTKRNLDFLSYVDYLGGFDSSMSLLLEDSFELQRPNEQFPGQLPNTGYIIEEFPKQGFIGVVVSLLMSDGFAGAPEDFAQQARSLPDIEVRPW